MFEQVAVASALLLPFLFLWYVGRVGSFDDAIVDPPWLLDYAREGRRRWSFGTNAAMLLVSITLLGYIYGGIG